MIRGLSCGFFCMHRWQWHRTQPQSRWFEGCCCSQLTTAIGLLTGGQIQLPVTKNDNLTICTGCRYRVTSWQWRWTQPQIHWFEGCCCWWLLIGELADTQMTMYTTDNCSRWTTATGGCWQEDRYNCRWQKIQICTRCKYRVTSWQISSDSTTEPLIWGQQLLVIADRRAGRYTNDNICNWQWASDLEWLHRTMHVSMGLTDHRQNHTEAHVQRTMGQWNPVT